MKALRKVRFARLIVLLAPLLVTASCSLSPHSNVVISKRYEVGNSPSAECLDAAKRATYWCESGATHASSDVQSNCSKARWDHARAC